MTWTQRNVYYKTSKVKSNGRAYDSKFEAGYGNYLDNQLKHKKIKNFETHKGIDLLCNGYKVGTYYIDFVVHHLDGIIEYVETKGWATDVWKLKWKIFCSMYEDDPNYKLTLVKQSSFNMRKIKKI